MAKTDTLTVASFTLAGAAVRAGTQITMPTDGTSSATATGDLTGSQVVVRLDTQPTAGGAVFRVGVDSNNYADFYHSAYWNDYYRLRSGGVQNDVNANAHYSAEPYLRLRVTSGQLYWETSADGTAWTVRRGPVSPGFDLTNVSVQLLAFDAAASVQTVWGSINPAPAGPVTVAKDEYVRVGGTLTLGLRRFRYAGGLVPPVTASTALTPQLAISAGRFVRADTSQPVILAGGNFMSHEHRGSTSVIAAGLAAMRADWGGNLAVYGYASRAVQNNTAHPYTATPYLSLLDQIVQAGKAQGCYTVFAPRWSGIEGRDTDTGPPTQTQYVGVPPQEAVDSLGTLAARYKNEPSVMFKCQVETNGAVTHTQLRAYSQACYDKIRATGSTAVVITSGLNFGRTINGFVAAPVVGSNVAYGTHVYETQAEWVNQFTAAVDAGLAVFIGEFGQPFAGGGAFTMTQTEVDQLLGYTRAHGLAWAGWAFEADQNPTMVADEVAFTPTEPFGLSVRNEMQRTPAVPGGPVVPVAPTPRGLTVTAQSSTSVLAAWTAVTGASGYDYRIGAGPPVAVTGTTATISTTAGTAVAVQVRATTAAGTSSWSPARSVTTPGGASISRSAPITASTASKSAPVTVLVDGQWDADSYRSTGYPTAVVLDLTGVPAGSRTVSTVLWAMDQYNGDNLIQDATFSGTPTAASLTARGTTYNEPGSYTLDTAAASTGPWTARVTVTDQSRRARTHRLDLTGVSFLRFNLTAGNPGNAPGNTDAVLTKLEVVPGDAADSWLFTGDSITAAGAQVSNGLGSKAEALAPTRKPIIEPLGIPGSLAVNFAPGGNAAYRARWLAWLDETACRYVPIGLGTNDASGGTGVAGGYETAMRALIADVTSRGKTPVVPTILWSAIQDPATQALNARLAVIRADTPAVLAGPDLYGYFKARPTLIGTDGIHPTVAGYAAWSDLWAATIAATDPSSSASTGTFTATFQGTF